MNNNTSITKNFLSITSNRDLAIFLGIDFSLLKMHFLHYYKDQYHSFEIRKKNGGTREILAPCDSLKTIQKKLSDEIYKIHRSFFASHGFENNKDIYTNAMNHTNQKHVLNIDLENFFPSIHYGRVYGMFRSFPFRFNEKVARTLANLCTFEGLLPQGAPTSPIISNIICKKMDRELLTLAKKAKFKYSRYADDITFSGNTKKFPKLLAYEEMHEGKRKIILSKDVLDIIDKNSFTINALKTRLLSQDDRQEVTGLVVNRFVNVNRNYIRNIKAAIHNIKNTSITIQNMKYAQSYKSSRNSNNLISHLKGKINFVGRVRGKDDHMYMKLMTLLYEADNSSYDLKHYQQIKSKLRKPHDAIDKSLWVIESTYEWEEKVANEKGKFSKIKKFIVNWFRSKKTVLLESRSDCTQGTAFKLKGFDGLVTCRHNLYLSNQNLKFSDCYVYQFNNPSKRYNVKKISKHHQMLDLAIIDVDFEDCTDFDELPYSNVKPRRSETVYFAGFPDHSLGAYPSIVNSNITQQRTKNGKQLILLDRAVKAGTSGGPILNKKFEVVGVVTNGGADHFEADSNSLNGGIWIGHLEDL